MTRAEYDRLWKEYKRAFDSVAVSACSLIQFLGTSTEPRAMGHLMGSVMRYKLIQADLPKRGEVTP